MMTQYRRLKLCVLSLVATSVLQPQLGLADSPLFDTQTLCQPFEIHDGEPDEKACFKELGSAARRDDARLTLGLANGKTKVINDAEECKDSNQEAACVTYRLVGRLGEQYYIVLVAPYECAYITLVDRKSGAQIELGGWPRLSPDRTRFAVIEPRDAGNCDTHYAIAIFSLTKGGARLEWQFKPDGFELYEFDGWRSDNRLRFLATGAEGKQAASDLSLTAQGWQLRRPNGDISLGTPILPAPGKSQ